MTGVLTMVLDDQVARNRRRATTVVAASFLAVLAVLLVPAAALGAGAIGLAVAVVAAAGIAVAAFLKSGAVVLAMIGARPADPDAFARVHNLVEGLCATAGLPKPGVYVVEDDALNACAVGRGPRTAAVAVTTGLARGMDRIELEGALAHELCHVKNHDVLVSTVAAAMVGPVAAVLPLAPVARLLRFATGTGREELADLAAVTLTRYPPGLIAALEKLRGGSTVVRGASRATAHLWLAPPLAGLGIRPSLEDRIAVLREL